MTLYTNTKVLLRTLFCAKSQVHIVRMSSHFRFRSFSPPLHHIRTLSPHPGAIFNLASRIVVQRCLRNNCQVVEGNECAVLTQHSQNTHTRFSTRRRFIKIPNGVHFSNKDGRLYLLLRINESCSIPVIFEE